MMASAREKMLVSASAKLISSSKTISAVEIRRRSGNSFETVVFLTLMG